MFLELLGFGILAALASSRSVSTPRARERHRYIIDSKPVEVEKVVEVVKRLEVNQVSLDDKYILIECDSSDNLKLYYKDINDLPTLNDNDDHQLLTVSYCKDTYYLHCKKSAITAEYFVQIQDNVINNISSTISEFHDLAYKQYLRDSSIEKVGTKLEIIISNYKKTEDLWNSKFSKDDIDQLLSWDDFLPLAKGQIRLREQFESKALIEREVFFDKIESMPLTAQQRLAVIRNNDLNLVLAAAGTGKTSVIVAKALDLIDSNHAKADQILILAYNKAASKELQERIISRGSLMKISEKDCPTASTFHALGKKILTKSNQPSAISVFAEDQIKLEMWVTQWLINYIKSSPESLKIFIELFHQPINPFDFSTKEEYDAYVRDNEYRTLQGELVRGYQELLIANWFFLNGVEYEYEEPYVIKHRIDTGFDYRPDFHFKNTTIYLEHFGIDRNRNTRKGIDKITYNERIESKRKLHRDCQTTLLETYHYDWVENNLENRLAELVTKSGLKIQPKSPDEVFQTLNKIGFIEESAKRYLKSMRAIRVEALDKKAIFKRLSDKNIVNASKYTDLLDELHQSYKKELENQKRIDFDDMIIKSTEAIISGNFKPYWTNILVDEFQDISMARMDFLKTLIAHGPAPILTVVGDDWQSIYRFSGGKLELTTRIGDILGTHSITKLEKTFRYSSSIADVAGTFIMQNPEQYKKNVETKIKDEESKIYLLDSNVGDKNDLKKRVLRVVQTIRKHDAAGSIAVLARYNHLLENIETARLDSNVHCWTFHSSKGLEADYCILIGFVQGKNGFPNMNMDEAVTEALLPTLDDFPHSEERRLLYVAITRARKKSYIIADPMAPSKFINEMLTPQYNLHIASKSFEEKKRKIYKCPLCADGYYRLHSGPYGDFYACTSRPFCKSKPRTCDKCGAPSIDSTDKSVCNDDTCRNEKAICDKCGRPMKIMEGKFGKFLGCSGFGIEGDRCKNKRKLF